jgi:hypothetical protein
MVPPLFPPRQKGQPVPQPRIAAVVSAGPNGEADDTTANVYWCRFQRGRWDAVNGVMAFEDETAPGCGGTVRAVNISEPSTSHEVAVGGSVYVQLTKVTYNGNAADITGWVFTGTDGNVGEQDGEVEQMTSQLTKGWALVRLVHRPA